MIKVVTFMLEFLCRMICIGILCTLRGLSGKVVLLWLPYTQLALGGGILCEKS